MTEMTIPLPPKLVPIFSKARGSVQYREVHGGRGNSKSFNFAKMAAAWGYAEPLRIFAAASFRHQSRRVFTPN